MGEFDPADIDRLKKAGFTPHFHIVSDKSSIGLGKGVSSTATQPHEGKKYFVVLSPVGEPYTFPVPESQLPQQSIGTLDARIASLEQEKKDTDSTLAALNDSIEEMEHKYALDSQELDKYFASVASESQADGMLSVMEGFAPTEIDSEVTEFLDNCDHVVAFRTGKSRG